MSIKFKVEDVVIIRELKEGANIPYNMENPERTLDVTTEMAELKGRITRVERVYGDYGEYVIAADKCCYTWNDNMLYFPSEIIKLGTKLKVREDLHVGTDFSIFVNQHMAELAGKTVTVENYEDGNITIKEEDSYWKIDLFEKVVFDMKGDNNIMIQQEKVILKPEQKATLVDEMCELLEEYRYDYTRSAVEKIVDEWFKAKEPIIRILSKHPNWNPDKFQIQFTHNFNRVQDEKARKAFFAWLKEANYAKRLLKPFVINGKTLDGVNSELFDIQMNTMCPTYLDGVAYNTEQYINNLIKEIQLKAERSAFKGQHNTKESRERAEKATNIFLILCEECTEQYVSQEVADKLNAIDSEMRVHRGHKTTKVVGKFCRMYECDTIEEVVYNYSESRNELKKTYGSQYAKYCDAMNPLEIKRHTVLSLNPIDYLTMSFGNTWASCHTIDKLNLRSRGGKHYHGCYSSGTMSYMLDETSLVFYTVNADYNGEDFELEDKISRNMFHFGADKLIQGRVYPFDQTDDDNSCGNETYKPYREIVQKIFADCMEVPNLWYNKKGAKACEEVSYHKGTHYPDLVHYGNCNVSYLRKTPTDIEFNFDNIQIGRNPICIECGGTHSNNESINCCREPGGVVCACCGSVISASDIENGYCRETEDGYCCDDDSCAVYCEYHDCYEVENDQEFVSGIGYFCEDGIENDHRVDRCISCGEVCRVEYEGLYDAHGDYYCDSCAQEELTYVESDGDYYPSDETEICEECGNYFVKADLKEIDGLYYCADCAEELEENEEHEEEIA